MPSQPVNTRRCIFEILRWWAALALLTALVAGLRTHYAKSWQSEASPFLYDPDHALRVKEICRANHMPIVGSVLAPPRSVGLPLRWQLRNLVGPPSGLTDASEPDGVVDCTLKSGVSQPSLHLLIRTSQGCWARMVVTYPHQAQPRAARLRKDLATAFPGVQVRAYEMAHR